MKAVLTVSRSVHCTVTSSAVGLFLSLLFPPALTHRAKSQLYPSSPRWGWKLSFCSLWDWNQFWQVWRHTGERQWNQPATGNNGMIKCSMSRLKLCIRATNLPPCPHPPDATACLLCLDIWGGCPVRLFIQKCQQIWICQADSCTEARHSYHFCWQRSHGLCTDGVWKNGEMRAELNLTWAVNVIRSKWNSSSFCRLHSCCPSCISWW